MPSSSQPATGTLLGLSAWSIHRRVIGAFLVLELLTRYGRNNIGFLWLFLEPMLFTLVSDLVPLFGYRRKSYLK